ncbi:MAG: hypothetical protein WHX52_22765 [Anaerolineae bacterium]
MDNVWRSLPNASTSTMVKYDYAGSQRVAMRQGSSTLYYLLGDHGFRRRKLGINVAHRQQQR